MNIKNEIYEKMKRVMRKNIFLLSFFFLCSSCFEVTRPFLADNRIRYTVPSPDEDVSFRACSFGPYESFLTIYLNGDYLITPKTPFFKFEPNAIEVTKMTIIQNSNPQEMEEIPDTIQVNGESEITFRFRYRYKEPVKWIEDDKYAKDLKLLISPSKLVFREGKAVSNEFICFEIMKQRPRIQLWKKDSSRYKQSLTGRVPKNDIYE